MPENKNVERRNARREKKLIQQKFFRKFEPLAIQELTHVSRYSKHEKLQHDSAVKFFEDRLQKVPDMPRYNACLAALKCVEAKFDDSERLYTTSLSAKPGDIMVRNDYALQLARSGKLNEAIDEVGKGLVVMPDQGTLRNNMAALLARKGDYQAALTHAVRCNQLNPNDTACHRNLARLYEASGDTRTAYEHNVLSMRLDIKRSEIDPSFKPNPAAFRAAAVEIIAHKGSKEEACQLMSQARKLEGKKVILPTSQRTIEIINQIQKRQGNKLNALKQQEEEEKALKERKDAIKSGNVLQILEQERKAADKKMKEDKEMGII